MISQDQLKELLEYNKDTGVFTNKVTRNSRSLVGRRSGSIYADGYRVVKIDGIRYYEHQLAWLYAYGVWPVEIDHLNGVPADNRLSNLRLATRSENMCNSEYPLGYSSVRGVCRHRDKWKAEIQIDCQRVYLGVFDCLGKARKAYYEAAETYHGEFALHNREG